VRRLITLCVLVAAISAATAAYGGSVTDQWATSLVAVGAGRGPGAKESYWRSDLLAYVGDVEDGSLQLVFVPFDEPDGWVITTLPPPAGGPIQITDVLSLLGVYDQTGVLLAGISSKTPIEPGLSGWLYTYNETSTGRYGQRIEESLLKPCGTYVYHVPEGTGRINVLVWADQHLTEAGDPAVGYVEVNGEIHAVPTGRFGGAGILSADPGPFGSHPVEVRVNCPPWGVIGLEHVPMCVIVSAVEEGTSAPTTVPPLYAFIEKGDGS